MGAALARHTADGPPRLGADREATRGEYRAAMRGVDWTRKAAVVNLSDDLPHTDPPQIEDTLWAGYGGAVAFDVGGHRGESVRFLEARGFTAIHIFEPDQVAATEIARRYPHHTVAPLAVSDHGGTLTLCYGNGMLRDPYIDGLDWVSDGPMVTVPCLTLDDYCAVLGHTPDLVKVDVEGGEVAVVGGASALIAARRTAWLIEFHNATGLANLMGLFVGYRQEVVRHPLYAPESDLWRAHGWLRAFPV